MNFMSLIDRLFPSVAKQRVALAQAESEYTSSLHQRRASRINRAVVEELNAELSNAHAEFRRVAAAVSMMPPSSEEEI